MRRTVLKTRVKAPRKVETTEAQARRLLEKLHRLHERLKDAPRHHPDAVTTVREIRSGR